MANHLRVSQSACKKYYSLVWYTLIISNIQLFLALTDFFFSVHNYGCGAFICFFENNFFVVNKLLECSALADGRLFLGLTSGVFASFILTSSK